MRSRNIAADFTLKYGISKYKKIEEIFETNKGKEGKVVDLHFLLAIIGLKNNSRVSLEENRKIESEDSREFSIRTTYNNYRTEMDKYYALITILDNTHLEYDEVINELAFQTTSNTGRKFYELDNIKTYYEYMMGGIDILFDNITELGNSNDLMSESMSEILANSASDNQIIIDEIPDEILDDL